MIKRTLTCLMTLALSFALCATAAAEMKKFSGFSVDVPAGWTAAEQADANGNKAAVITNAAKKITVMVSVMPLNGKTIKEAVDEFAKQVGGKAEDLGDGVFGIAYKGPDGNDITTLSMAMPDGKHSIAAAVIGDTEDPEVEAIINSIDE